jgi:hypothetical protein
MRVFLNQQQFWRLRRRPAGQAMTEFCIALVAFLVVSVGVLQIGQFCRAKVETMIGARADAGRRAIADEFTAVPVPFVGTWTDGPDLHSYTEDDLPVPATADDFMSIASRALSRPFQYPFYTPSYIQNNAMAQFMDLNGGDYSTTRGWAVGTAYRQVPVNGAFQRLVFNQRHLLIGSKTVLPPFHTRGLP